MLIGPLRRNPMIRALIALMMITSSCWAASPAPAKQNSQPASVEDLDSRDPTTQRKAREALTSGGRASVPELLKGLDSANERVKIQALTILREIRFKAKTLADDQIADYIGRKAANEPDSLTRMHMVNTLAGLKGASATRELKRFASEDPQDPVRVIAMGSISRVSMGDESAFFRSQLKDQHEVIRLVAYLELAKSGDQSGRDVALKILERPPTKGRSPYDAETTREAAIAILGYIANPADISRLKALSESSAESARCRTSALFSYHRAQSLQLSPDQRLDALMKALDGTPDQRFWAAGELSRSKDPRATSRLKQYLNESGHLGYRQAEDALNAR